jgi:hypothetical protein
MGLRVRFRKRRMRERNERGGEKKKEKRKAEIHFWSLYLGGVFNLILMF